MTPELKVSPEAARRFLSGRHYLAPARSLTGGPDAIMQVVHQLGSLQFDPLSVAGRNHDLVLHARVADYEPAWCEDLLYKKRMLFEAYNKGLSLLPVDELPWYRVTWDQNDHSDPILLEHAGTAKDILKRIRDEGPLTALDFESGRTRSWFGTPMSVASAVLNAYAAKGILGLARRDGNRRYYDLIERLFPADLLKKKVPPREQYRHKLLSRYRAHGLLGVSSPAIVGTGPAKPDPRWPGQPSRTELREELIERGDIVPVDIEGVNSRRFVLREEVDVLMSAPEPPPSVCFLAPLDPMDWDPKFLQLLYGFDWVWEVYLAPDKRRWGYYVLPILFRDRLVGKIQPRIDRAAGRVSVLGLTWEEGFMPRQEESFLEAMNDALRAYLRFAGASSLDWAPHLAKEKRLFRTLP